jgi:hypothetical protein
VLHRRAQRSPAPQKPGVRYRGIRTSLGSWMTFEHMSKGRRAVIAPRESGIDFLDDARYDDRTGTAPIPTGYPRCSSGNCSGSQVGVARAVVANKLWLERLARGVRAGFEAPSRGWVSTTSISSTARHHRTLRSRISSRTSGSAAKARGRPQRAGGARRGPPQQVSAAAARAVEREIVTSGSRSLRRTHFRPAARRQGPVEPRAATGALEQCGAGARRVALLPGKALTGQVDRSGCRRLGDPVDGDGAAPRSGAPSRFARATRWDIMPTRSTPLPARSRSSSKGSRGWRRLFEAHVGGPRSGQTWGRLMSSRSDRW